jgi:glycosyltransferase involved in cell wall biosynthesis
LVYKENRVINGTVTFFHGLNESRVGFKGTNLIKEAMENVKARYPSDVNITFGGNLSFEEYTNLLSTTNIVIDQSSSYCLAMNALNSMAMGRVVMGGAEPIAYEYLGSDFTIPAFNILPDVKDIESKMIQIIDRKSEIPSIGLASRRFVENYFNYKQVASQFINTWSAYLN